MQLQINCVMRVSIKYILVNLAFQYVIYLREQFAGVTDPAVRSLKAHNAIWIRTGRRVNMVHVKCTWPAHTPTHIHERVFAHRTTKYPHFLSHKNLNFKTHLSSKTPTFLSSTHDFLLLTAVFVLQC